MGPSYLQHAARVATTEASIAAGDYVSEYLRDGASNNLGVSGTVDGIDFIYVPPAGRNLEAARLLFYLETAAKFDATKFASLPVLDNGVQIVANDAVLTIWRDNIDVANDMYDLSNISAFGKASESLSGRWTFTRGTGGRTIRIPDGSSFKAVVRDDLSRDDMIFRIKLQGYLTTNV